MPCPCCALPLATYSPIINNSAGMFSGPCRSCFTQVVASDLRLAQKPCSWGWGLPMAPRRQAPYHCTPFQFFKALPGWVKLWKKV